jgi:hypothetical protein
MKASELSEQEWVAHQERMRQTLERADETLAGLEERAALRWEDGTERAETWEEFQQRHRENANRERAAAEQRRASARQATTMDPERSRGWNDWWDKRAGDLLKAYDKDLLEDVHKAFLEAREISRREQRAAIDELRVEITKSEVAVTELLIEQEKRIAAIERRFNKPRLVGGGSDAA